VRSREQEAGSKEHEAGEKPFLFSPPRPASRFSLLLYSRFSLPFYSGGDNVMKFKLLAAVVILSVCAPGYAADKSTAGDKNKPALVERILCPTKNDAARQFYNNGLKLADEGRLDEAAKEYAKAIDLDPSYCDAMDNLGQLLRFEGKLDEAVYWYKRSIAILPSNRAAHTNLAVAYRYQGKKDDAVSEYRILLKIDARDPEGYYGLGTVYLNFRDFGAACENLKKAEQLYIELKSPLVSDAQYALGLTYYQMKEYGKAVDYLEKSYSAKHDDQQVNYMLGLSYLEGGKDLGRAGKYLKRAQELGAKIPPEVLHRAGIK
jgi:Flp pilus assembly protein TadD